MPRKKTAEAQVETTVTQPETATREPGDDTPAELKNGHAAKKEDTEHSKISIPVGDLVVHYLDKGSNKAGVGIFVEKPENRELTEAEKEAIRTEMHAKTVTGRESPQKWNGKIKPKMWHAEIGEDAHPAKAVAIRLDAESRTQNLAEALKHAQKDPEGYQKMVQQQREQAENQGREPF